MMLSGNSQIRIDGSSGLLLLPVFPKNQSCAVSLKQSPFNRADEKPWGSAGDCCKNHETPGVGAGSSDQIRVKRRKAAETVLNKIADRAKQNAVVKNSRAETDHALSFFERIPSDAESRPEIIAIRDGVFSFITHAVAYSEIFAGAKFIVKEKRPNKYF